MLARIENALFDWLKQRREERLLHACGGIQTCPWCRQIAQSGEGWRFAPHQDGFHDILTCGVCGGTSLWRFELGMVFAGALDAPKAAFTPGG